MHKIGDLLKELGFNKDAPLETQKAFFRHLVVAAVASQAPRPAILMEVEKPATAPSEPVQLSFKIPNDG